ncbi:HNH endonuclease signature motif containing protein [Nocardioides korecus]
MTTPVPEPVGGPLPGHPLVEFGTRLLTRLEQLSESSARPVWSLTPAESRQLLVDLAVASNQLEAIRLAVLAEADRSGATGAEASASAAEWVAGATRQRRTHARSDLALGRALEVHLRVAAGMAAGVVNPDQARVITRALDRLPTSGEFAVTDAQRDAAEVHLVRLAAVHDAKDLEVLGARVLEVIAPDLAEAHEGRLLEAQEAAAARKTSLTISETPDGLVRGRFTIPVLHGAILGKAITGLASPVRRDEVVIDPDLPAPVRHGIAFTQLLEALPADRLPTVGGGDITVVVTMRHDHLLADLETAGVATLDTGHRISAGEARRLACAHRIVPAVLGGASAPLDLGRARRLHTRTQRLALALRDGGCTATGCDRPPAWCQAHHDHPWSTGGRTDTATGRLLCGHHHRRIHDPAYTHHLTPDGRIEFHRRE